MEFSSDIRTDIFSPRRSLVSISCHFFSVCPDVCTALFLPRSAKLLERKTYRTTTRGRKSLKCVRECVCVRLWPSFSRAKLLEHFWKKIEFYWKVSLALHILFCCLLRKFPLFDLKLSACPLFGGFSDFFGLNQGVVISWVENLLAAVGEPSTLKSSLVFLAFIPRLAFHFLE